jgi:two-component system chemotaxis response regulator CheB
MTSPRRDVVVIGGSAGAVEALTHVLAQLPLDLGAAVAVVLHRHPDVTSNMARVFSRGSKLEVVEPEQGQPFDPGCVYLAPPDRHMVLCDDIVHLNRQPRQHHTRPAIDPLFRSAARSYGRRVIGVLLTGNLSDGVGGLIEIKQCGGLSLVQEPGEARFPSMPRNALIYDHVDLVFRLDGLVEVLAKLVSGQSVAAALGTRGVRPVRPADVIPPAWVPPGHKLP